MCLLAGFGAERAVSIAEIAAPLPFETEGAAADALKASEAEEAAAQRAFNLRLPRESAPDFFSEISAQQDWSSEAPAQEVAVPHALREFAGPKWLQASFDAWKDEHPEALAVSIQFAPVPGRRYRPVAIGKTVPS